jgi:hypothetical protein
MSSEKKGKDNVVGNDADSDNAQRNVGNASRQELSTGTIERGFDGLVLAPSRDVEEAFSAVFGKSTTAQFKGSDGFETIKDRVNKGEFNKPSVQWVAENLTEPKFTKAELVKGLLWCREEIENLLPVYDNAASLSLLLEAETRDDKADNVIQWDEFNDK